MEPCLDSYLTPGFPEFYDEMVAALPEEFEVGKDLEWWYGPVLDAALAAKGQATVLDLGAGSGRVTLGLAGRCGAGTVHFVGMDHSEEMLAAAARKQGRAALPARVTLEWCCCGWAQLLGCPAVAALVGRCDLITMSTGNFHHLLTRSDQARCLAAVAALLSTRTPAHFITAIFPPDHLHAMVGSTCSTRNYQRTCLEEREERTADGGTVWHQRFRLVKVSPGGEEAWRRDERWVLRAVGADEFVALASAAGLRVVRRGQRWAGGWQQNCGEGCIFALARGK